MRRLIPDFILQKNKAKQFNGSFEAWILHVDLQGFTSLSNELIKSSQKGAEILRDRINSIFIPAIKAIEQRSGFISTFAGDAFTAVFAIGAEPGDQITMQEAAISSAIAIRDSFINRNNGANESIILSARIGIAKGPLAWKIIPDKQQSLYWFSGDALRDAISAQQAAGLNQILIHSNTINNLDTGDLEHKTFDSEYSSITGSSISIIEHHFSPCRLSQKKFVSHKILAQKLDGEFREVLSCFINIREENLQSIRTISDLANKYGAYLNKVFYSAQGPVVLLFWGAPTAYEDGVHRCCRFVHDVRESLNDQIRIGLSLGMAFAGYLGSETRCEYSCMGLTVNLAARLTMQAAWGETIFEEALRRECKERIKYDSLGLKAVKGFPKPVQRYRFIGYKDLNGTEDSRTPFTGRKQELDQLVHSSAAVYNGSFAPITYVYGDPGKGKTRLVNEFMRIMKDRANIATLQCDSILQGALHPLIHFVRWQFSKVISGSLTSRTRDFKQNYKDFITQAKTYLSRYELQELKRVESVIAGLISITWKSSYYESIPPHARPQAINSAISTLFAALAKIKPLIIVFEDIQWLDEESRTAWNYILKDLCKLPVKLVISARYRDDGALVPMINDEDLPFELIHLGDFEHSTLKIFVKNVLNHPVSESLVRFLDEYTLGNLLYIEQICFYLLENKLLEEIDSHYHLKDTKLHLSSGINALLMARIDRLDSEMKHAVQAASVLGTEFTVQILQELLNRSKALSTELTDPTEIMENGKKERLWTMLNEVSYSFSHGLLRETAYSMQLDKHLCKLHTIAAEIMEDYWGEDNSKWVEIAKHYEKGKSFSKAYSFYHSAAEHARDQFQFSTGLDLYNKALQAIEAQSNVRQKETADTLMGIGVLHFYMGKYDIAMGYLNQAEKIYSRKFGERDPKTASCYGNIANVLYAQGDLDGALGLMENALSIQMEHLGAKHPYTMTTISNIGQVHYRKAVYDKAIEYYARALDLRESVFGMEHQSLAETLNNLGLAYCDQQDFDLAARQFERAIAVCQKAKYPNKSILAASYNNAGKTFADSGDPEKALTYYNLSLDIRKEVLGLRHPETVTTMYNIAEHLITNSQYEKAKQSLEFVHSVWCETLGDRHPYTAVCLNSLGRIQIELTNYSEGIRICKTALGIIHEKLGSDHPWCEHIQGNITRGEALMQDPTLKTK